MNDAVAKLEFVSIRRGLYCEYDPNVIREAVDKSAERRENRRDRGFISALGEPTYSAVGLAENGTVTLIIEVVSVELDGPRREARRLESIIGQEKVEAFVVPGAVLPEILRSWGVTKVPVFRIDGVAVWEGEAPPGHVVRSWLHWPKSLDEAAERLLSSGGAIPEGPLAHLELGTAVRNSFGLWGANKALLHSCGSESMSADDASAVILKRAREVQKFRQGEGSK